MPGFVRPKIFTESCEMKSSALKIDVTAVASSRLRPEGKKLKK